MAPSVEEQQFWVARLLKKIQKSGYKATGQVRLAIFDHKNCHPISVSFNSSPLLHCCSTCEINLLRTDENNLLRLQEAKVCFSLYCILNFQTEPSGTKISPQESMRSQYKPAVQVATQFSGENTLSIVTLVIFQAKSATLPANSAPPKK